MDKSDIQNVKIEKCRNCSEDMPVNPGYVTWCDRCGWNINPNEYNNKKDVRYRISKFLGKKLSSKLFHSIQSRDLTKKYFSLSRLLTILFATLIYLISLAAILFLCGFGLYLILSGLSNENFYNGFTFVLFGAVMLLISYFIIPKYKKSEGNYADKQNFIMLVEILDRIADSIGTNRINKISFNEEFNASYSQTFMKGERVLNIGLPLFYILSIEEKIAVLSHEIAHGANTDISRGRYIGGAFNTLANWYRVICPGERMGDVGIVALLGPLMVIVHPIRLIFSKLILALWYIFAILSWRDNQRSEYLADDLASKVAGTDAMINLLRKLHYSESFWPITSIIYQYGYSKDFISEYTKKAAAIPERELLRIERLNMDYLSSVDATHPPTKYRINLMEYHYRPARLVLNDYEAQQLENELSLLKAQINEKILSICRSA